MIQVNVKVNLTGTRAELKQKQKNGQYALINQALVDMNRYVPKLEGDLRNTGTLGLNGKTVHWNTPYARAQFYGTNGIAVFRNYTTNGTGPRWDNKAKGLHMKQWESVAGRAMQ